VVKWLIENGVLVIVLLGVVSCGSRDRKRADSPQQIPFESRVWKEAEGDTLLVRLQMVKNLQDRLRRTDMSRNEILLLLGQPEFEEPCVQTGNDMVNGTKLIYNMGYPYGNYLSAKLLILFDADGKYIRSQVYEDA
jgi:hypothetical protein